ICGWLAARNTNQAPGENHDFFPAERCRMMCHKRHECHFSPECDAMTPVTLFSAPLRTERDSNVELTHAISATAFASTVSPRKERDYECVARDKINAGFQS